MRLAKLTSSAVPPLPGAVRMGTSLARIVLRAIWLGVGASEAPIFAILLRLPSEQLRARIIGVAAERGPNAVALCLLAERLCVAGSRSLAFAGWSLVLMAGAAAPPSCERSKGMRNFVVALVALQW